jgi:replication fork protection complex subunit Tof1/Swi1
MAYLSRYRELEEPEQVKRVVGLMHRQVIKTQAEGLYYKVRLRPKRNLTPHAKQVSYLNLFRRVLDEQQSLPTADSSQDLVRLIKFVVSKFFKRVATDPFLVVQALGPKSRGHWKELSSYKSDDESDDESDDGMDGQKSRIKEKVGFLSLCE